MSIARLRRTAAAAALLGLGAIASVNAVAPAGGPASAAAVTYDACGVVQTKADGTPWTCSFVDEFNGTTLDRTKWIVQQTAVTGFHGGLTCFTASEKNVRVRRGILELVARAEKGRFDCKSPSGSFSTKYTGGMVGTRGSFSQTYGRFEARAKFPSATTSGVHGAFWMNPLKQTYGPWPASGEIDVAEWWSNDPTLVLPSLHYNGRKPMVDSGWGCRVSDPSSYHTYAVEWLPTELRFFIDGALCFARAPVPDSPQVAPQPFDHPFSMILSMGVGTETGTNAVTASTPLPATFTVDYAKAWR